MKITGTVAKEFARVISCDYCSRNNYPKLFRNDPSNLPQPGYIGSRYRNTRVLLVGQNPGVYSDRTAADNKEHADAQIVVRDNTDVRSMAKLKNILDRTMPTWSVSENYFPLAECGLQLDDVAYVNLVRCRTRGNAMPGQAITQACINNHFIRWLDWLKPRVVVCIGKWAHDNISVLLGDRGIPSDFINRQRSLSTSERQRNKQQVVSLVRGILSGNGVSVTRQPQVTKPARTPDVRNANASSISERTRVKGKSTWSKEQFTDLFRELGFHNIESRKTLKHRRPIPSLYFNNNREGAVYFTGYKKDQYRYPDHLWIPLPPQQDKDMRPSLITVIPKAGKEREAFRALLGLT